jgi:CDGSH-type Zn-finger protein
MEEKLRPDVVIHRNGPIEISGNIIITQPSGIVVESKKTFLCRCGASEKKPYCDGTHKKIDFKN